MKTKVCQCESCQAEEVECAQYAKAWDTTTTFWMCDLCANTRTGAYCVRDFDGAEKDVLQTMCYVGNAILKAIRDREVCP